VKVGQNFFTSVEAGLAEGGSIEDDRAFVLDDHGWIIETGRQFPG
jgi:hypothetical protein